MRDGDAHDRFVRAVATTAARDYAESEDFVPFMRGMLP